MGYNSIGGVGQLSDIVGGWCMLEMFRPALCVFPCLLFSVCLDSLKFGVSLIYGFLVLLFLSN